MLARKFDIDDSSIAFDRDTGALTMTVEAASDAYDEVALLVHGWGVLAGCKALRRLVVTVVTPAEQVAVCRTK